MLDFQIKTQIDCAFSIQKLDGSTPGFKVDWTVPGDLPYFQGHFPNKPVLPAIAIIDISLEILNQVHEKTWIKSIKSCKFTHPITPHFPVEILLSRISPLEWSIQWKNRDGTPQTSLAQISLILQ